MADRQRPFIVYCRRDPDPDRERDGERPFLKMPFAGNEVTNSALSRGSAETRLSNLTVLV
jgi:hypothetical protein